MMRTALVSATGPRENLEDAALASAIAQPGMAPASLLLVLDGVGGHNAGEKASGLGRFEMITRLSGYLAGRSVEDAPMVVGAERLADVLTRSLIEANQAIVEAAERDPTLEGMATTIVCAVVMGDNVTVAWVGDSRCYQFRQGRLRRLTHDHSVLAERIERGLTDGLGVGDHPDAHTITRFLGQANGFRPEIAVGQVEPGDLLVLCTDGLTDVLTDRQLEVLLGGWANWSQPLEVLPRMLVREALDRGTTDNVTVLVAYVEPVTVPTRNGFDRTVTQDYVVRVARRLHSPKKESSDA